MIAQLIMLRRSSKVNISIPRALVHKSRAMDNHAHSDLNMGAVHASVCWTQIYHF